MPRRRPSQPTVFSTPSKSGIDLSVGLIKLVSVPSAAVRRLVGGPVDAGAAAGSAPRNWRGDGSPLSQVGVTLVLNFKPALCSVGGWREREWKWGRERRRLLGEARGALKGPGEHTPPLTAGPVLDKWPSKVQGNLPR